MLGSLLGVLVLGMIQTFISFEGTLSSWWTKIAIGALLLVFVVMQRVITRSRHDRAHPSPDARAPVMEDVARLAGVSHQTVSRVINGHASIRPETRERVAARRSSSSATGPTPRPARW